MATTLDRVLPPGWTTAEHASADEFDVRPIDIERDYEAYVQLYTSVWDPAPIDVWPRRRLLCISRYGGSLLGAYCRNGDLVGADLCIPGIDGRRPIFASNGLCVASEYRGRGVGRQLRLAQRDKALSLGIRCMIAPYDALDSAQAGLYVGRLGQVGIAFVRNFFGAQTFGAQRGSRTDRVILSWQLASTRVSRRIERLAGPAERFNPSIAFALRGVERSSLVEPEVVSLAPASRQLYLEIPDRSDLERMPRELASRWRDTLAEVLEELFARGYRITDFLSVAGATRRIHGYLAQARRERQGTVRAQSSDA